MKNILRALALSLVVTGAVASTHIANAKQATIGSQVSAFPVPGCDPSQGGSCGMCDINGNCSQ